ncbi:Transcriptional regulatory protein ZraR [Planctomycetes bacterium Pan216]|uniref:Transcriptional regulatory protein ZraR n=1 Tax=Kolteria novifilia TaxID=2527975 RepID=A0A518BD17_9BACT|nr:Transcriptional regulatory protein ZraR [Planctomycetes bacterium Pan216]
MATADCTKLRILFADDEKPLRELMRLELPRLGHDVTVCDDGRCALDVIEKASFDVALLDIRMPGLSGIEVLKRIKEVAPETEVVLLTGHATVETAVESLRYHAFDYLTKPCKMAELEAVLHRVAEKRALLNKTIALENRLRTAEGQPRLVGGSKPMQRVADIIAKVAPTDSTVLVLGETGTGKEVVARTLHEQSQRSSMPFVPVNCGALPEHLVESELFGHRKGAFTGADQNRKGLFEVANGGTLFLDEVGELPKSMQAKLLRFLESGEVRRVGENEPFRVDVRVLCATNRGLRDMVADDDFREDLYFRINTFEIELPGLRERPDDIATLAEHLLMRAAKGKDISGLLTPEAIDALKTYTWPGNVRELANVMEYAYIVSGGEPIGPDHLPGHLRGAASNSIFPPASQTLSLHELEMQYIVRVLDQNEGNKPETAKQLGISLKTLYNKLNLINETNSLAG